VELRALGGPQGTASSTGFGVGVPCKVFTTLFFGPTFFVLIKYEFSKCFTDSLIMFSFHYARGGCLQKANGGDGTDFAWAGDRGGPYFPDSQVGLTLICFCFPRIFFLQKL
jgi:hypothetical protein